MRSQFLKDVSHVEFGSSYLKNFTSGGESVSYNGGGTF